MSVEITLTAVSVDVRSPYMYGGDYAGIAATVSGAEADLAGKDIVGVAASGVTDYLSSV